MKNYNVYFNGVITVKAKNKSEASDEAYEKLKDIAEFAITGTEEEVSE